MNSSSSPEIKRLRILGQLLDTKFKGPYGIRFGLDAVVGLIPVVGDISTTGVSLYIVYTAYNLGAGPSVLLRMMVNIMIENLISVIPLFGNLFDFYWKSNMKNVELVENYLLRPRATENKSTLVLILLLIVFIAFFLACVLLAMKLVAALWAALMGP